MYPQPILPYHYVNLQGSSLLPGSSGLSVSSSLQPPSPHGGDHAALLGARLTLGGSSVVESTSNDGRDGGLRLKEEGRSDASSEVTQLKEELEVLMKVCTGPRCCHYCFYHV